MENDFQLYEFSPLFLTLQNIGPFRDAPYEVDFTDRNNQPCNFFMLVAANGFGKTTVLESISCVMDLLGQAKPEKFGLKDLDFGNGRIQMDFLLRCRWEGRDRKIILSVLLGQLGFGGWKIEPFKRWEQEDLKKYQIESWHQLGYYSSLGRSGINVSREDQLLAQLFIKFILRLNMSPSAFNEGVFSEPNSLLFSAYRNVVAPEQRTGAEAIVAPESWGYQSAFTFSSNNQKWTQSLDNLLVWLKWLDDGRFEKAQDLVNKTVFKKSSKGKFLKGIRRDPPQGVIGFRDSGDEHRLDQLSSGEKSLLELVLRIGTHMTKNTIVMIDEFDIHLHIRWQYLLFEFLKDLAARPDSNITVILTTHSTDIFQSFLNEMNIQDEGLSKGGHLIERGLQ